MDAKAQTAKNKNRPPLVSDYNNAPPTLVLTHAPMSSGQRKRLQTTLERANTALDSKDTSKWKTTTLSEVHAWFWGVAKGLSDDAKTVLADTGFSGNIRALIPIATHSLTAIPLAGHIESANLPPIPDLTYGKNSYVLYNLLSVPKDSGIFRHTIMDQPWGKIFKVQLWRPAPTSEEPDRWLKTALFWRSHNRQGQPAS